jgi:hypothetical protein
MAKGPAGGPRLVRMERAMKLELTTLALATGSSSFRRCFTIFAWVRIH